jgi:hypothetical protein
MKREGLLGTFAVMAAYYAVKAKSTLFGRIHRPAISGQSEIANLLAEKIRHKLSIPDPPGYSLLEFYGQVGGRPLSHSAASPQSCQLSAFSGQLGGFSGRVTAAREDSQV